MAGNEQRAHERKPFSGAVKVTKPTAMDGTGLDLSVGGVAAHMPSAVETGTAVEVSLLGASVAGTVRLCVPHADGGFRVGIQWQQDHPELAAKV